MKRNEKVHNIILCVDTKEHINPASYRIYIYGYLSCMWKCVVKYREIYVEHPEVNANSKEDQQKQWNP